MLTLTRAHLTSLIPVTVLMSSIARIRRCGADSQSRIGCKVELSGTVVMLGEWMMTSRYVVTSLWLRLNYRQNDETFLW